MHIPQFAVAAICFGVMGLPETASAQTYAEEVASIEARRIELASQADKIAEQRNTLQAEIVASVERLTAHWLGSRWGLGAPQSRTPRVGKTNCGTFVGTVLRDAGFNVKVSKLQRQPSQLIIKSFVGRSRMKKFSNKTMKTFLAEVKEMGPGLFIIGLDFHVGFLIQTDDDLRFVHASYETETVVDESAAIAVPITSSKYRVVGKILSDANLRDWLDGRRIKVKGKW